MFLQPAILLWGLPLILLPVLIHFLNRLRYRNVAWAAMMFLLAATRSSTRHARIRQWLLLLLRMLAVAAVVFALSRPHVGGWVGLAFGGPPDTVILIFDRSASMGMTDPRTHQTLRQQAARLLTDAAMDLGDRSSFVLIDSLSLRPQVLKDLSQLPDLPQVRATDAAADMPAMLDLAAAYLLEHRAARPEIWIASDLQASSWRPESSQWANLSAQLAALPQKPRIRLLAVQAEPGDNLGVTLLQAARRRSRGREELALTLAIRNPGMQERQVPLQVELDGVVQNVNLSLAGPELVVQEVLPLAADASAGWGIATLPADANDRDNAIFFGYAPPVPSRSVVVADDPDTSRLLQLAAAPAPDAMNQQVQVVAPAAFGDVDLGAVSLVIWQSALPAADAQARLQSYVAEGGSLLLLPSGQAQQADSFCGGLGWTAVDTVDADQARHITAWEEDGGPLASTSAGERLPLERVAVLQRQGIAMPGADVLASLDDGVSLVELRRFAAGQVVMLGSLPRRDWSNLAEGSLVVPLVQRLLLAGGARLSGVRFADAGQAQSEHTSDWKALGIDAERDPRRLAGVFQTASGLVALNRPGSEDDATLLDTVNAETLFTGLTVSATLDRSGSRDKLQGEITTACLAILLLALVAEAVLTTPTGPRRGVEEVTTDV